VARRFRNTTRQSHSQIGTGTGLPVRAALRNLAIGISKLRGWTNIAAATTLSPASWAPSTSPRTAHKREKHLCLGQRSSLFLAGEPFPSGLAGHTQGPSDPRPGHSTSAKLLDPGTQVGLDLISDRSDAGRWSSIYSSVSERHVGKRSRLVIWLSLAAPPGDGSGSAEHVGLGKAL
jgi:hypothetical protein